MTGLKLTYFDLKGRAEICRLILAQAGVEYEDNRIEREQWASLKQGTHLEMHFHFSQFPGK